jgi:ABC-type sugar transport system substrate-binding protein
MTLTLAACGGDDSGGGSAAQGDGGEAAITDQALLDEARQVVEKYRGEQKFVPPGPAIDVGSQVQGKTVYWIGNANQVPIVRRMLEAGQEALETVGMNVIVGDAKGQPSLLLSEIDKAISRDVDAIVTTSFSPDSISAGLKAAKAAGIPVILGFAGDPGIPTEADKEMGIAAKPSYCYSCGGKVAAAQTVVDAADNGIDKVQAASFQAPESPNSVLGAQGYVDELKRLCPANCTVETEDAPVAKWGPDLTHQVESLLRREPDLNYIYASFDNILDWAIPGIATVGATDRVRAIGFNGSDVPMQNLQDGKGPVIGEIWNPAHWTGWAMADAIIRTVLGEEPSDVAVTQDKLFMGDDAKDINIKESRQESWYGDLDYAGEYKKLWGVE